MDNLLEPFIKEPEKEFYVRQLSKLFKKSPTTVSKYLKKLEKKKILKSRKKLNHLLFKANDKNEQFKQLKLNYNLNLLHKSGLVNHIVKIFNFPEAIILFGSFAKAEDIPASDIDLVIISPLKKEIELSNFEKKLKHKIQVFVYSKKEIEKIKGKDKEFLNNLVNGIVVYGFWEVFNGF